MKVRDESQWQQWLAELADDPDPLTPHFREFVVTWAEHAEERLQRNGRFAPVLGPAQALREALESTEIAVGWTPTGMIGMALIALGTHWAVADTDALYAGLSPIERHLFAEMAAHKVAELQMAAAETQMPAEQFDEMMKDDQ